MTMGCDSQTQNQVFHADVGKLATEHLEHRRKVLESGKAYDNINTHNHHPSQTTSWIKRIENLPQ